MKHHPFESPSFKLWSEIVGSCDKIVCVGKNYLQHAKELGDAIPKAPVLFNKPPSVGIQVSADQTSKIALPAPDRGSCHYETEIVLRMGEHGQPAAVSLGLDLTLRDLQRHLKDNSLPWEIAKCFPSSIVVGPWLDLSSFPEYLDTEFSFSLDSEVRQQGRGRDMQWQPDFLIQYISGCFPLLPGDLLFTGTPHGVGPLQKGQTAEVKWGNKLSYRLEF